MQSERGLRKTRSTPARKGTRIMEALDFRRATMARVLTIGSSCAATVTTIGAARDLYAAAVVPTSDGLMVGGLFEAVAALALFVFAWRARGLVARYVPPSDEHDHA